MMKAAYLKPQRIGTRMEAILID